MNLLITGISSNIGIAIVRKVAPCYKKIFGQYRTMNDDLRTLADELDGKLSLIQCDLKNDEQTVSTANSMREFNIDHFVHLPSSSSSINTRFLKSNWSTFEDDMNIVLRSAVIFSQAVIDGMVKRKYGKIVFMLSSYCVNKPTIPYSSGYVTVKSGLLGLMESLSSEFASKFITVNAVSPSMLETKFWNSSSRLLVEKSAKDSPIGRNLTVDDVVPTFEFLLSRGADCITGQNIAVTAGN